MEKLLEIMHLNTLFPLSDRSQFGSKFDFDWHEKRRTTGLTIFTQHLTYNKANRIKVMLLKRNITEQCSLNILLGIIYKMKA